MPHLPGPNPLLGQVNHLNQVDRGGGASPQLGWLMPCCSSAGNDGDHRGELRVRVQLSTDDSHITRQLQAGADSLDAIFTPRTVYNTALCTKTPQTQLTTQLSPRQLELKKQLELPFLPTYPDPPDCSPEDPKEDKKRKLLDMYQEFACDLRAGMYLSSLTSSWSPSKLHVQLMEDMLTLKLDQESGRIVEFPLTGASKVYRIARNSAKPTSLGSHIVVMEFALMKLAFAFTELRAVQRFAMCMELLIRRAQQEQATKAQRAPTPAMTSMRI